MHIANAGTKCCTHKARQRTGHCAVWRSATPAGCPLAAQDTGLHKAGVLGECNQAHGAIAASRAPDAAAAGPLLPPQGMAVRLQLYDPSLQLY